MSAPSATIRETLLKRRAEIEQRLERIKKDMATPLDQDFAEQAVEAENREVLQAIGRDAQMEISEINNALLRMEEGTFGECIRCGEAISAPRLTANPYASRCMRCAVLQEKH